MTPQILEKWLFLITLWSGGIAFGSCFGVLVIQPRNTPRYFGCCFGWVLICFGNLFWLGAWQAALKEGHGMMSDWRVAPGVGLWAVGLLIAMVIWFGVKPAPNHSTAIPENDALHACTSHARWISVLTFVGGLASAAVGFGLLANFGSDWMSRWIVGVIFVGGQIPGALLAFVFLPRCVQCAGGRMKIVSARPMIYRCKTCGASRETPIALGRRR